MFRRDRGVREGIKAKQFSNKINSVELEKQNKPCKNWVVISCDGYIIIFYFVPCQ
jgi:hypothetical protein